MMWQAAGAGFFLAVGLLMVWGAYRRAHPTLAQRVKQGSIQTYAPVRNPWVEFLRRWGLNVIEQLGSTHSSVMRRLELLGSQQTMTAFRIEQMIAALVCMIAVGALSVTFVRSLVFASLVLALIALTCGAFMGVALWDQLLTWRAKKRQERIDRQVPDTADLLALALGAGESIPAALERMSRVAQGDLSFELGRSVAELHGGKSTTVVLSDLAQRNDSRALDRLCQTLITALERGSPLAAVLHDQAQDLRETSRQQLLEEGGKREIYMLIPVVFMILPITVLFALYPGLSALQISP